MSKEEYDTCRLDKPNPRVVAKCDQQQQQQQQVGSAGKPRPAVTPFTITFRPFSPQPKGLEFTAGQDYYFISALVDPKLDAVRRFSPCRELNMKVIFKVCCKSSSGSSTNNPPSSSVNTRSNGSISVVRAHQQQPSLRAPGVVTIRPSFQQQQQPKQINKIGALFMFVCEPT